MPKKKRRKTRQSKRRAKECRIASSPASVSPKSKGGQDETNRFGLRRYVPGDVRRRVRQECGFGCVICGSAFYEYEHFDPPFADATEHQAAGIACLCGGCHSLVTRRSWSKGKVATSRQQPHCLTKGLSRFQFDVQAMPRWVVRVGSTAFINPTRIIEVNGEEILAVHPPEGNGAPPRISARFQDRNGKEVASINSNEWCGDWSNFDIETSGSKITVRSEPRKIDLVIKLTPPDGIVVDRLQMNLAGATISGSTEKGFLFEACSGRRVKIANRPETIRNSPFWISIDGDRIQLGQDTTPMFSFQGGDLPIPASVEAGPDSTVEVIESPLRPGARAVSLSKHGTSGTTASFTLKSRYPVNLSGKGPLLSPDISPDLVEDFLAKRGSGDAHPRSHVPTASAERRAFRGQEMRTSFLILSDTHFCDPAAAKDMTWWNRMLKTRSPEIADSMVSTVSAWNPDFVLHCGDLTDDGTLSSFQYAQSVMDRMSCPYYVVLGNHDTFQRGTREAISGLFENTDGKFYYARTLCGLRFVFLDCAYWIRRDGREDEHLDRNLYKAGGYLGIGPSEEELKWLQHELGNHRTIPTIVVGHTPMCSKSTYPVGSLPTGKPVRQHPTCYRDFAEYCVRYESVMQTIRSAGNVKAVLAGHWHIFDITCSDGTYHCQTGSMIEFPFEMRWVQVNEGYASMTTVGLNEPSFRETSVLDELGNRWVAGEREDRTQKIDLR